VAWYPRFSLNRTEEKSGRIHVRSSMNLRLYLLTGPDGFKVPRKGGSSSGTCKYSRDIVNRGTWSRRKRVRIEEIVHVQRQRCVTD